MPGISRPRSGDHWPHSRSWPAGHSGSTRSSSTRPARHEVAHPVAEGPVVLDVDRAAVLVLLDVRRAVEVALLHGQPARARVVREGPPGRVRDREDQPAARPQHPGDLAHRARRCRRRTGSRRTPTRRRRTRRRGTAAPARRPAPAAVDRGAASGASSTPGLLELAVRHVERRDPRARRATSQRAPCAAPQPTSSTSAPGDVAQQVGVRLPQALRAPEQVGVAEEVAVLVLVVDGARRPTSGGWPRALSAAPRRRGCTTAAAVRRGCAHAR